MQQSSGPLQRKQWIIIGALLLLLLVIIAAIVISIVVQQKAKDEATAKQSGVTATEVNKQNLSNIESSMNKAKTDQAAAQSIADEAKK